MRILTKMYNILGLLEQAVVETDAAKKVELCEQAKNTPVHCETSVAPRELFQMVFGTYPNDTELDQVHEACSVLIGRKSITTNTRCIYAMEMPNSKTVFGETEFFRNVFGVGDEEISQEALEKFKAEIGRAELTLGKIGDYFCLNYRDGDEYTFFWDRLIADNSQNQLRSLYLSNGALRHLAAHRITEHQFNYLCRDLRYQSDKQLSKIKVRSGEIDPAAVIHWLYGEQEFSSEISDLILTAVQTTCNNQGHNCWSELLHLEFGQDESSAAWILGGTVFDYPLDALQEKLRAAMWAVNENFLRLRNSTKRRHKQNQDATTLARPYSMP